MQSPINKKMIEQSVRGYILIELAFVMVVLSILLAVSIPLYNSYEQRNAIIETEQRMEAISKALSVYAQNRFRLPCPADSNATNADADNQMGMERAACDAAAFAGDNAINHGIVPYRTLGVPEQYAKDGYGNFFTYVVSPDFTTDNRLTIPAGNFNANDRTNLRLAHLVAGNETSGNYALLPRAKFCAPINVNITTDLTVNRNGAEIYDEDRFTDPDIIIPIPVNAPDPNLNVPNVTDNETPPNPVANRDINVTAVALALISHGENGRGAYQNNGGQFASAPAGSAEEITSNNTNNTVQMQPEWDNNYDDIVQFYTQDQIYALAGRNSCEHL